MDHDEKVKLLREDIRAAQDVADVESTENGRLYEFYRSKKLGNEVKGRSQIVSSDVFETVEWALPALMDIFDQANGIPEVEPQGVEDEDAARKMTQLIRYQFWRQNEGETILRQAIKDALLYRPGGIIKYCWTKEVRNEPKKYEGLSGEEFAALLRDPDYKLVTATDTQYGYDVEAEFRVVDFDGPRIHLVPPWEFLRHPNARDVKTSPFVCHKKKVTVDYLRRMEKVGVFRNVEKAIGEAHNPEGPEESETKIYVQDNYSREEEQSSDEARKEVDLYECYVRLDVDGDGMLENRIICLVGNTVIRDVENVYKTPPFVVLRGIEDTHKFSGITMAEMVEDLQKFRTFLLRQMVDNLAQANNARKVYDPSRISHADLMNNVVGAPIRTTKPGVDVRTALTELQPIVSTPTSLTALDLAKVIGEERTGISKSFKGLSDQYQQTASGQYQAINQASQRIRMIAKIIGTGLNDLFRAFIFMNKSFLTQDVMVRLENEPLQISPDDLEGKMDLILNIFLGASTRQQKVVNLQQLLAILGQLVTAGMPVLDAANTASILREMVSAMEFKGPERFLPMIFRQDPMAANQQMMALQAQQAMLGGEGGGGQTIGSIAGNGGGGSATTNPAGAGGGESATQPYSGSMVPGFQ